nr:HNH endonuclease signature motif containing protein [Arthrobacter sp. ZGTC412]
MPAHESHEAGTAAAGRKKCTFPGCSNPSLDNDADHLKAWHQGGNTGISNLAQLCPKHHRLKHNSPWTPTPATEQEPPGWTSPTGRHYKAEHHDWEPPQWPPELLPAGEKPGLLPAELPPDEPAEDNFVDPDDIPAGDGLWDDFYAMPYSQTPEPSATKDLLHF